MKVLLVIILTFLNVSLFAQNLDSIAKMEYNLGNKNFYTSTNPQLVHGLFIERNFNQDSTYLLRDYLIVEGHYNFGGDKTFTKIAFHFNESDSYDCVHVFKSNSPDIEILFVNSEIYTGRASCNYSILFPHYDGGSIKFKYFI